MTNEQSHWQKFFAWKPVPTPDYIRKTSWLEFVFRRKNPFTGKYNYKKMYSPEEEVEVLNDRIAW